MNTFVAPVPEGIQLLYVNCRIKDGVIEERYTHNGVVGEWHPVDLKARFDLWYKTYAEESPHRLPPDQTLMIQWWSNYQYLLPLTKP